MKRYFFGILAIVLALGVISFKAPAKSFTNLYQYDGDVNDLVEVEKPENWKYAASGQNCFLSIDEEACEIISPVTHVGGTLPPGFMIVASQPGGASTPAYVSGVQAGSTAINRAETR